MAELLDPELDKILEGTSRTFLASVNYHRRFVLRSACYIC